MPCFADECWQGKVDWAETDAPGWPVGDGPGCVDCGAAAVQVYPPVEGCVRVLGRKHVVQDAECPFLSWLVASSRLSTEFHALSTEYSQMKP